MSRYRSMIGLYGGDAGAAAVRVRVRNSGRCRGTLLAGAAGETHSGEACAMPLPSNQVFLRVLSADPSPGIRTSEAIAEQASHFDEGGDVETIRVLGREQRLGDTRVVLFALARRKVIDTAFRNAERHALEPVALVPELLAVYNGAAAQLRTRHSLLCIRITPDATDLFLGRDRVPLMARRLPLDKHAFENPNQARDAWDTWTREMKAALAFACTHWPEEIARPRHVVVFGEKAHTAALRKHMETMLENASFADAADLPEARRQGGGAGFTLALGCALTALGRARIPISVFPETVRVSQALRRHAPWWTAAALFTALGMLFPGYRLHQSRVYHRRQVGRLQNRLDRATGLERELQMLQSQNQALRRGMAPLRGTVYGSDAVRRALQAVASAKHENDWIILAADAEHYLAQGRSRAGRTDSRSGMPIEHIIIEGYTPAHDLSTVRAMIERLRQYTFITEADLLADDRLRKDADRDRVWAPLECRLFALEIRTIIP